ncbi:MAG TPA: GTPase [Planctomycetota bacterium]
MNVPRLRELTAAGRGAIRVLELAGPGALRRVAPLLGGRVPAAGDFARVELREPDGTLLDEALLVVGSAERVELHLHGSEAVVERVRAHLGPPAAPEAAPSLEEQAERRLLGAASERGARILLDQAEGALRAELRRLLGATDEELLGGARALARRGQAVRALLAPPRIVLAGAVNAGKSTLFNLLVGRERVVVSATPGTTRDVVRERARLGELVVELHDTAGMRALLPDDPGGSVERAGQALARAGWAEAELVLWLAPAGSSEAPPPLPHLRVLHSLADLDPGREARAHPSLSVLTAPDAARATVERVVLEALGVPREPWPQGTAVPFEPEHQEVLACAPAVELRRWLADWLAAGARLD